MLFFGCDCLCSSTAVLLAGTELVSLRRVLIPQILIPEHPPVVDGVAMGAVVVTIRRVRSATGIVTVVRLCCK